MPENLIFYLVFLSQILLISFYYPRRILNRMKYVRETYPPSTHPKLYPRPAEFYERRRRAYQMFNVVILLAGLLILVALFASSAGRDWEAALATGYFFLQLLPVMLLDLSLLRDLKLMREANSRRTAELRPRRLSDFISHRMIGAAVAVYLGFVLFVVYFKQFEFAWFGGYWNVVGITFMNLLFGGLILWQVNGRKLNPHQAHQDRLNQIELNAKVMVWISIAATVFVALNVVLGALELRHLQPVAQSLYFQLLAAVCFQAYSRIGSGDFEGFKEDALVN